MVELDIISRYVAYLPPQAVLLVFATIFIAGNSLTGIFPMG